jgi:IS4 transposase
MASLAGATRKFKSELQQSSAIFSAVLEAQHIAELCQAVGHRWRNCFWSPAVVIITFLRQVLLPDCSCRQTVAFTLADPALARKRWKRPDADPSAYSQARQRLPLALYERLARGVARQLDQPDRRWHGHRVRVVDGSSVSMPDTPELQEVFPQPSSQAPGCGFPVARLLAIFCWHTGACLELVNDALGIGELTLLQRVLDFFGPGDLLLADRLYGNYAEVARLRARGAQVVARVNRARHLDLRKGRRLGKHDRQMVWQCPRHVRRVPGATGADALPETLTVRVVRVTTECRRAFRQRQIDIVTTLLDPCAYPAEALGELYRERWLAELSLRSFKTTLGMDVLRCRSPQMIRKELAVFHLTYNLIRVLMRQAARRHGLDPQQLSFAGTRQRLLAYLPHWTAARTARAQQQLFATLLTDIADDPLPFRPDRHEPRAIKRRRKSYPYLVHARHQAQKTAHYDKR